MKPPEDAPVLARALEALRDQQPFVWLPQFIQTAFAQRLLSVLDYALATRRWYVVFAQSGDGKSTTLRRFRSIHPEFDDDGVRKLPVLATRTPTGRRSADHLLLALVHAVGTVPNLRMTFLRPWLVNHIVKAGVHLIVIDDAHELTLPQLNYLRELTDQLADRGVRVGVVLLSVVGEGSPAAQPLWRLVERSGLAAVQFKNRLDGGSPLVLVKGLSRRELGAVLKTLEQRHRAAFPELQLARWTPSVFTWLTDVRVDHAKLERVRMGAVCDLVRIVLEEAWATGQSGLDESGETLHRAAIRLATRGSTFDVIDGGRSDERKEHSAPRRMRRQRKAA